MKWSMLRFIFNNGPTTSSSSLNDNTRRRDNTNDDDDAVDTVVVMDNDCDTDIEAGTDDPGGMFGPTIHHLRNNNDDDIPKLLQHRRKLNQQQIRRNYDRLHIISSSSSSLNPDDVELEYETSSYSTGSSSITTTTGNSNDSIQSFTNDNYSNGRSFNDVSTTPTVVNHSTSWWLQQQLSILHQQFLQRLHRVTTITTRWTTIRCSVPHSFRSQKNSYSIPPPLLPRRRRPTSCITLPSFHNNNNKTCSNNNNNKRDNHSRMNITFRKIHPTDKKQIQQLHEQWFPVKYLDEFYDDLVYERMTTTGDPLFTCVGTIPILTSQSLSASSSSSSSLAAAAIISSSDEYHDGNQPLTSVGLESQEIVACVVGCFIKATTLSGQLQKLLITNIQNHTKLFYIMTVGTTIRNQGIGTILIEKCIQQVLQDKSCGVLYLHVLTTNFAAIQMYEQLGFHRVMEIPNYYTINYVRYNCYLYAKYYHGNRGHLSSSKLIQSYWIIVRDYCYHLPGVWNDTIVQYLYPNAICPTNNSNNDDNDNIRDDGIHVH